jgi:hypothetical protein
MISVTRSHCRVLGRANLTRRIFFALLPARPNFSTCSAGLQAGIFVFLIGRLRCCTGEN